MQNSMIFQGCSFEFRPGECVGPSAASIPLLAWNWWYTPAPWDWPLSCTLRNPMLTVCLFEFLAAVRVPLSSTWWSVQLFRASASPGPSEAHHLMGHAGGCCRKKNVLLSISRLACSVWKCSHLFKVMAILQFCGSLQKGAESGPARLLEKMLLLNNRWKLIHNQF